MNEVAILRGAEPRRILQTAIEKKVPAVMSYLSKGKEHTAKALLSDLGANRLDIQLSPAKRTPHPRKTRKAKKQKPHPINVQVNQPVNISLKCGYGKFVFETTVVGFEPSSESSAQDINQQAPTIVVMVPDKIEIIQRRNFFRVSVPSSLKVNVTMWRRFQTNKKPEAKKTETKTADAYRTPPENYWRGKLVDLSAGGMQIAVDARQKTSFKKGLLISLRFTPMPYEEPLVLNAQIRNILHTADEKGICLGLQIVGSKTGHPDQQMLHRLCNVAEHYHQINQYSTKQQDFLTTGPPR